MVGQPLKILDRAPGSPCVSNLSKANPPSNSLLFYFRKVRRNKHVLLTQARQKPDLKHCVSYRLFLSIRTGGPLKAMDTAQSPDLMPILRLTNNIVANDLIPECCAKLKNS